MKCSSKIKSRHASAYTLVEVMIAGTILTLVVLGMVSAQIFGLRTYSLARAKLTDTGDARRALDEARDGIRQAFGVTIGNYISFNNMVFTTNSFPAITNGLQQGNAIMLQTTTNPEPFLVFYLDTPTGQLNLYDSTRTNIQVLANNIVNTNIFFAENYLGQTLSNNQDNRTIRMTLEFFQRLYVTSTRGNMNDYYQLTTRVTQRFLQ